MTATTTAAYPFSASWGNILLESCLGGCRFLQKGSTQSPSMGLVQRCPPPTWYSHSGDNRKNCREQRQPLSTAFIDLADASDLVSRAGLFLIVARIDCPPTPLIIMKSFHEDLKGASLYDGSTAEPFNIGSEVKRVRSGPHTTRHLPRRPDQACL